MKKVKVTKNAILEVKKKNVLYVGSKLVVVKEIIEAPTDKNPVGHFPLYRVAIVKPLNEGGLDKEETYTHRFFKMARFEVNGVYAEKRNWKSLIGIKENK